MGHAESAAASIAKLRRSLRRIARADFERDEATEDERARLAGGVEPVTTRVAQDYAAWRRPILWTAGLATLTNVALGLFGYDTLGVSLPAHMLDAIGMKNVTIMVWLTRVPILLGLIGSLLVLAAALAWRRVRVSVQLARSGWLLMFAGPFILSVLPYAHLMDLDHVAPALRGLMRTAIGGGFAVSIFITVGPLALSLFPGIIRSSLALKTMLPEAPLPGWAVVLVGPLYSLFLLIFVSGIVQAQGSFFLLGGVACLMASSAVYVLRRKRLIKPQTAEEGAKIVRTVKLEVGLLSLVGLALVAVFVIRGPNFGAVELTGFLTGVVGNVVLLTVVGGDFILGIIRSAYLQNLELAGTELQASLAEKLEALGGLGVLPRDLPSPPPVREDEAQQ